MGNQLHATSRLGIRNTYPHRGHAVDFDNNSITTALTALIVPPREGREQGDSDESEGAGCFAHGTAMKHRRAVRQSGHGVMFDSTCSG